MAISYDNIKTGVYAINSNNISVFPCAYRGANINNNNPFDPEAKLNTERNLINLAAPKTNSKYIESWKDNKLQFVLGGYHFIVDSEGGSLGPSGTTIRYVAIRLTPVTLIGTKTTPILANIKSLATCESNTNTAYTYVLDEVNNDIYYFYGLYFLTNEPTQEDRYYDYLELPASMSSWESHASRFGIKYKDVQSKKSVCSITGDLIQGSEAHSIVSIYGDTDSDINVNTATGKNSVAFGVNTTAGATGAFAEGKNTNASTDYTHAEGGYTLVGSDWGHAEGFNTSITKLSTSVDYPHAAHTEGLNTKAHGIGAHAEGGTDDVPDNLQPDENAEFTIAEGNYSHAEGTKTYASNTAAHSEGDSTTASGEASHAEGYSTNAEGPGSHAEGGNTIASNSYTHAEGNNTAASGLYSHAEGFCDNAAIKIEGQAQGQASHTEGYNNRAYGNYAHAEGSYNKAYTYASHAEGESTIAGASANDSNSRYAHAEGFHTKAMGQAAHAEGGDATAGSGQTQNYTIAAGAYSHAEGNNTKADGTGTHAEGQNTLAEGNAAHSEGYTTIAGYINNGTHYGNYSHAEGYYTKALGDGAHAEGEGNGTNKGIASGRASHSEGYQTLASGAYSHAEGNQTIAQGVSTHVFGEFNIADETGGRPRGNNYSSYVEVVGNGTASNAKKNARTLDWDGNEILANNLMVKNQVKFHNKTFDSYNMTPEATIEYDATRQVIKFKFN